MSDLDDDELKETKKFYLERYTTNKKANKELNVILRFKQWIEERYEDIINNETIDLYSMNYNLTEEEKNILRKRFL